MLLTFTPEQAEDLRLHLASVLSGDALTQAVEQIDRAAAMPYPAGEGKRRRQRLHTHARAIAKRAAELRELLQANHDDALPLTAGMDRAGLDAALELLTTRGRSVAAVTAARGQGRPPDEWRDHLVAVIFDVYPPSAAEVRGGSHFEEAAELVLGFVGIKLDNVHGAIARARARDDR